MVLDQHESYANLVQQWCRGGRDGCPAVAYLLGAPWLKEVPLSEQKTNQSLENAVRRKAVPQIILDWLNAAPARCPRQILCEYNSEEYTPQDHCCNQHQPEPESTKDMDQILQWKMLLDDRKPKAVRLPRSDGTYRALEPQMKASVTNMITHWRNRTWKASGKRNGRPAVMFLPSYIISRLVDKLHLCSEYL